MAPPRAAVLKKCLRLDPPPQSACARSLIVHLSRLTCQVYRSTRSHGARVGQPARWLLLCRPVGEMVNNDLAKRGRCLVGEAPVPTFLTRRRKAIAGARRLLASLGQRRQVDLRPAVRAVPPLVRPGGCRGRSAAGRAAAGTVAGAGAGSGAGPAEGRGRELVN